jgi:cytochrome c-type biogenesis protein CcmH
MRLTLALLLAFTTLPLSAQTITPQQIAKIKHLEDKLMAPCCFSQTIREHMSQEAAQMREEVVQMVLAGKSDKEITDYYREKYGEVILAVPDGTSGVIAYTAPFATLLIAGIALFYFLKFAIKRRTAVLLASAAQPQDALSLVMRERIRMEIGE